MRIAWIAAAVLSMACLWDYDTLQEESLGQADIAAIVGGDLHKHSAAFYTAKVAYTRGVIADPKTKHLDDRYDDLAVALAKTGDFDGALAALADKDKAFPNAYTTAANRGTVLAMTGDLAGAIAELKRAVAINPDAHFGRETYQIQLLEFLAGKHPNAGDNFLGIATGATASESSTIIGLDTPAKKRKLDPAIAAIAGLVRFGDGQDSPHLWYALAWAFVRQGDA